MVNLYSRTDIYGKWTNNSYSFGIYDCRACNLLHRKFGCVLEPLLSISVLKTDIKHGEMLKNSGFSAFLTTSN